MAVDQMVYEGTDTEVEIAREVFQLMVRQGALFAKNAPIRQKLSNLAQYYQSRFEGKSTEDVAAIIDKALSNNSAIFYREEADGDVVFITTKEGHYAPASLAEDSKHRLKTRLYEPTAEEIEDLQQRRQRAVEEAGMAVAEEGIPEAAHATAEVIEEAAPEIEEEAPEEVEVEEKKPALAALIQIAPGVTADLSLEPEQIVAMYGDVIEERLMHAIREDFRFVNFGDLWYLEELVLRFSKGDLKRFKEHILEVGEPVPDTELVTGDLRRNPGDPDFEAARFSLNYRLLREKKDFEFVGVPGDYLWSVSDLPPIGSQKKKESEIGQELKHISLPNLAEESLRADAITESSEGPVLNITLTYWDYENGFLPYDRAAMEFFPQAVYDEQRAMILRFDSPQTYVQYVTKLRLPTHNRGGWIAGMESYFEENLVPGAKLQVSCTPHPGYFLINFAKTTPQQENLLQFDEKKQRFVFRPVTYTVEVDPQMLLSQDKYPKLSNSKRLEEAERKKLESVIAWAFMIVGDSVSRDGESAYYAVVDDLLPVVNIEKPLSAAHLQRELLLGGHPQFSPDPEMEGAFFYKPPKS